MKGVFHMLSGYLGILSTMEANRWGLYKTGYVVAENVHWKIVQADSKRHFPGLHDDLGNPGSPVCADRVLRACDVVIMPLYCTGHLL